VGGESALALIRPPRAAPSAVSTQSQDRPAFVVFENVEKTYDGEHLGVADLDLAIRRGEFLALLGPSTVEAAERVAVRAVENVLAVLDGRLPDPSCLVIPACGAPR
jgi:hypothetical protein